MTPQQIKYNAPEGATHYCNIAGSIRYLRKGLFGRMMVYWEERKCWTEFNINPFGIKPL